MLKESINPTWNERIELSNIKFNPTSPAPIVLKVYDDDTIGRDLIGLAIIDVQERLDRLKNQISTKTNNFISLNNKEYPYPEWINLKYRNGTCKSGKILASFNFFEENKFTLS